MSEAATLEARVEALERLVATLLAPVASGTAEPPSSADRAMLWAVADYVKDGEPFTAADIVGIAEGDEGLGAALRAVIGGSDARRLGKAFARLAGRAIDRMRLRRSSVGREGAIWVIDLVRE